MHLKSLIVGRQYVQFVKVKVADVFLHGFKPLWLGGEEEIHCQLVLVLVFISTPAHEFRMVKEETLHTI